jgi:predicted nucleic acid-binding protein
MVRFWDTSAIIPLLITEPASARVRRWLAGDAEVVVWALTRVELLSALARRRREEPSAGPAVRAARRAFLEAWERWSEIAAIDVVRRRAETLVERHPLRAGDALQLGAALLAARDEPAGLEFVTLDERQAAAAEREGFPVLGP